VAARFTGVPKRLPISMLTLHSIMRGAIAIARTATPACSTAGDAPARRARQWAGCVLAL
jgi:hypothetical protein